ncbi:calmodulin-like protein 3 [Acropora muricata]|uniref:calmodulin-like protein 3 n=1 Tax=Acropora muricata TaxID=159855 RepID=UPI0034E4C836
MTAIPNQGQVQLRSIFRKFDKDSDGFISAKDLVGVFKELGEDVGEEELREQLHKAGLGHTPNTVISYKSFQGISKQILRETNRERRLKRVFQEFDVEKKGYIEALAIKRALRRLRIDFVDSDIDVMIKMADTKGDGSVDYDEFLQIFSDADDI